MLIACANLMSFDHAVRVHVHDDGSIAMCPGVLC